MQVTLKKAAALAALLLGYENPVKPTLELSIYSDELLEGKYAAAVDAYKEGHGLKILALAGAYSIRALIAAANHASGINELLTQRALVDAMIAYLKGLETRAEPYDFAGVERQRLVLRNESSTYGQKRLNLVLPNANDVAADIKQFTKERTALQEAIVEKNFSTRITLPSDVVALLTKLDLI